MDSLEGREPGSWRRVREKETHREIQKENIFPKPLAWKTRGAEFHEFLQPVGFEAQSFKGQCVWLV